MLSERVKKSNPLADPQRLLEVGVNGMLELAMECRRGDSSSREFLLRVRKRDARRSMNEFEG